MARSIKDQNRVLLSNEVDILGRRRVFQMLLHPVTRHYHVIWHMRCSWEKVMTAAEMFLAVKTLKAEGCDEIRPDMLKAE